MAVKLSPVYNEATLDTNGNPWSGAQLFTYVAGSSTKQTTYKDSAAGTPHTNPIILNARGEPPSPIWITSGVTYKFVLASPTESDPPVTATRSVDNISGINDTTVTQDQWVSGAAPTYISATSFSLVGDQTTIYHVGRRLKTTNTAGTVYSTISVSAFGAVTTITVVNDSGTLDSGLSAVSYGLLSAANPSAPAVTGLLDISASGAGQVKFPATQNASSNANTLDDYEEGTWIPSIGGSATYNTQIGTYTKIGRLVFIHCGLTINVIGTGSTTAISGLPFAAASNGVIKLGGVGFSGLAITPVYLVPSISTGGSSISFDALTAAAAATTTGAAIFQNSASVSFTGTYYV